MNKKPRRKTYKILSIIMAFLGIFSVVLLVIGTNKSIRNNMYKEAEAGIMLEELNSGKNGYYSFVNDLFESNEEKVNQYIADHSRKYNFEKFAQYWRTPLYYTIMYLFHY